MLYILMLVTTLFLHYSMDWGVLAAGVTSMLFWFKVYYPVYGRRLPARSK